MAIAGNILYYLLQLYLLLFFVRMILSWVPVISPGFTPRGPLLVVFEVIYTVTDPLINFYERFIPPLRIGNVALSLGFLAAMVTLLIAQRLVLIVFF